ncbi:hypothetical protein OOT00_13925 [Desulfobotulus sp. H1]|uniref:Uncharacterized protein n=1 Tax=Desulfobotulus pelophilus TaxID=2823377 RepID=A0ABT3NC86_9BACT|nr:hypothetical protein [Desulfobotulus pelophilus]MCW7755083.1 hypothetical protein [Desulfobotulus pelophilus]
MISGIQAYQRNENPLMERSEDRRIQGVKSSETASRTTETNSAANRYDRVSLSPEVEAARLRESLGLPIQGKITKAMLETRYEESLDAVNSQLRQARYDAGIPDEAEVTVRLTGKGEIRVNSGVKGSWELEKDLQEDAGFKEALASLSMHSRLNGLISSESHKSTNLSLFSDTGEERSLSSIVQEYNALRQNPDPLQAILIQARGQNSDFAFKHPGETS